MKSEYELSKHRFYELKHFCLQYPEWEKEYEELDGYRKKLIGEENDTTSQEGIRRAELSYNMMIVGKTCEEICSKAGYALDVFLLVAFDIKPHLVSGKEDCWYYYRKFFWELSRRKS